MKEIHLKPTDIEEHNKEFGENLQCLEEINPWKDEDHGFSDSV